MNSTLRTFDYISIADRQWDTDTLDLVGAIREHKGKQEFHTQQRPEAVERLIPIAMAQSTESSNRIEGIVTTDARMQQLLTDKTKPRSRAEEEIAGYRDVLNTIHESHDYIPLSAAIILQLHRDLYKRTRSSTGGQFKTVSNQIVARYPDGTAQILFEPLSPALTPQAVADICEQYNSAVRIHQVNPLLVIPEFILDFLCIHPFLDGNGRMSRLITTLLLYQAGFVGGKYISLEKLIEQTKDSYYEALRDSNDGWHTGTNDPGPFRRYLLGTILAAYREYERRIRITSAKKPLLSGSGRQCQSRQGDLLSATSWLSCRRLGVPQSRTAFGS